MVFIPFYAALLVYALFSSPTPDQIGFAEYGIAALFLVSVGIIRGWNTLMHQDYPPTLRYHRLFLLYMMTIPLAIGAMHAYPFSDILRDLIPMMLLILPLWAYNRNLPCFADLLMLLGGLFALRYCLPFIFQDLQSYTPLLYLANSPLVPFAAIFGFHRFMTATTCPFAYRLTTLAISILFFTAMALMLQRAPLGLSILACMGLFTLYSTYRPAVTMTFGIFVVLVIMAFSPLFIALTDSLTGKTLTVGWNNRFVEWQAVADQSTLFGTGWGGLWQSPAVADIWVRYTHNFISYFWLKAGMAGAMMAALFIIVWGWHALTLMRRYPSLGLAIAVPLIIHFTLYAGFKSLDFALILTLLSQHYNLSRNKNATADEIDSHHQSRLSPHLRCDGAHGL